MPKNTWNLASDAVTLEQRPRRSPVRWLHQHSLRIAVVLGLAEAIASYAYGLRLEMMLVGLLTVVIYLNIRRRIPQAVKRPLWVLVMAQAIGGVALPLVYFGVFVFSIVAVLALVVLALVMLGDLRRS